MLPKLVFTTGLLSLLLSVGLAASEASRSRANASAVAREKRLRKCQMMFRHHVVCFQCHVSFSVSLQHRQVSFRKFILSLQDRIQITVSGILHYYGQRILRFKNFVKSDYVRVI